MRKIFINMFNSAIFRLCAELMSQLKFPLKIVLIFTSFLIPIGWLFCTYLSTANENIEFVKKERLGVQYAQSIFPALELAGVWRYKTQNKALDGNGTEVDELRSAFENSLKKIEEENSRSGTEFGTSEAINKVRIALQNVKTSQGTADDIFKTFSELSQSLVDLLGKVADGSDLVLDPELPSYYLMSATLIREPQIILNIADLRGLGNRGLKLGTTTPELSQGIQQRIAVVQHEIRLKKKELGKVMEANSPYSKFITIIPENENNKFFDLIKQTFPTGQSNIVGDSALYMEVANHTLQVHFSQVEKNLHVLDQILADRYSSLKQGLWVATLISILSICVAVCLFVGFYNSMAVSFKRLRSQLINISMGDLRAEIAISGNDEMTSLLKEVNNMQLSLRDTVRQVQSASDHVVKSSAEIAKGTKDLSARTESAASSLEESSAALEQTTSTVQMTADSVKQASLIAVDNAVTATRGGEIMSNVVKTMESIQEASKKISDITGVIDGIAFQTNILALNAAVEAARAGEQGRGFAVVASEVRSLAGRSAEAAKEIKHLITSSTEKIISGTLIVKNAGETMSEIVTNADKIKHLLDEVATGAREQSLGVSQIGEAISELDRNTQDNAVLVEETADAANSQQNIAIRLAAQVDEFRLPGNKSSAMVEGIDIDAIIDGHRQWKVKLRDSIELREQVDVKTLCRDDCCSLGKWLYSDGQRLSGRQSFKALVEKHAYFHQTAGQIGALINEGSYDLAEEQLRHGTPFSQATSAVVLILSGIKRLGFE
ncbi:methyl-accepting chemotaxis protein [Undibacterium sp. MH2W]|uniref:methyl-accepting chemotaxis protein n=1 Tax=Undibacterium sp. MH2W TaxID=3413044 RepID=UPI003BF21777